MTAAHICQMNFLFKYLCCKLKSNDCTTVTDLTNMPPPRNHFWTLPLVGPLLEGESPRGEIAVFCLSCLYCRRSACVAVGPMFVCFVVALVSSNVKVNFNHSSGWWGAEGGQRWRWGAEGGTAYAPLTCNFLAETICGGIFRCFWQCCEIFCVTLVTQATVPAKSPHP